MSLWILGPIIFWFIVAIIAMSITRNDRYTSKFIKNYGTLYFILTFPVMAILLIILAIVSIFIRVK